MSNFAYAQTNIGEAITLIFAIIGIESAIVASEMGSKKVGREENETEIQAILFIVLVSNVVMILSIMGNYQLFIRWQRTKNYIIETDNLWNTGLYKEMCKEIGMVIITPYPFFTGLTYNEYHMYENKSDTFQVNDLLLCFMIFLRVYFVARSILSISFYTDPRS